MLRFNTASFAYTIRLRDVELNSSERVFISSWRRLSSLTIAATTAMIVLQQALDERAALRQTIARLFVWRAHLIQHFFD
jgi:hypothetical protein